jgi:hypothetical protein
MQAIGAAQWGQLGASLVGLLGAIVAMLVFAKATFVDAPTIASHCKAICGEHRTTLLAPFGSNSDLPGVGARSPRKTPGRLRRGRVTANRCN